jgi:hypothetical protein
MKKYVWTEKAEARANELGLEKRLIGQPATYAGGTITGMVKAAWVELGWIREADKEDECCA